jgi:hypothetical protein
MTDDALIDQAFRDILAGRFESEAIREAMQRGLTPPKAFRRDIEIAQQIERSTLPTHTSDDAAEQEARPRRRMDRWAARNRKINQDELSVADPDAVRR